MKKLSVRKLVKLLRERATVLENDGAKVGYPSTNGLLIFAALVLEDKVLGNSDEDVLIPFVIVDTPDEVTSED